jgi:hypothetical protein
MAFGFKAATHTLFMKLDAEDLAAELGCPVQAIEQARSEPASATHRAPPPGWDAAVALLARHRARQLLVLAEKAEKAEMGI